MDLLIYAVVILLIVGLAKAMRPGRAPKSVSDYEQHDTLFTAAERSFLGVLDKATADRYRVFGKVRVADVLRPTKGLDKGTWFSLFNQIKAKHFDFVLCDPKTLKIRAVIELNDKSHAKGKRVDRDIFIRAACVNAGLELIEVPARRSYSMEVVRQALAKLDDQPTVSTVGEADRRIEPTF